MVPDDSLIFKMWLRESEKEIKLREMKVDYRKEFWNSLADRYVVMQFTGLHDKNQKEIYEGDIVRHTDSPHGPLNETYIYSIAWNDSGFALLSPKTEIPTTFILDKKWGALLEIIGNIYENPELLGSA